MQGISAFFAEKNSNHPFHCSSLQLAVSCFHFEEIHKTPPVVKDELNRTFHYQSHSHIIRLPVEKR